MMNGFIGVEPHRYNTGAFCAQIKAFLPNQKAVRSPKTKLRPICGA